jgi:uncharacterized protein
MTFSTQLKLADDAPLSSTEPFRPSQSSASGLKSIFVGRNGLRAGWRLLIFLALCAIQLGAFLFVRVHFFGSPVGEPAGPITATPIMLGGSEAIQLLFVLVATVIMGRIEHRRFSEYGLPLRQALGEHFWLGCLWGFLAISGALLAMFLLHDFRISGLALHGTALLSSLMAWSIAFFVVGIFEEFFFRGYVQYTLASGIGFWPAAFVFAVLFGLGHAFRSGETVLGAISAGSFGILFCLFLQRTGNLWAAVGFHAGWDWGQTFFYGVPNSALLPSGNLFHSTSNGPLWLSGGSVGPEASIFCPIALLVVGVIFSRYYRENRYQMPKPGSLRSTAS